MAPQFRGQKYHHSGLMMKLDVVEYLRRGMMYGARSASGATTDIALPGGSLLAKETIGALVRDTVAYYSAAKMLMIARGVGMSRPRARELSLDASRAFMSTPRRPYYLVIDTGYAAVDISATPVATGILSDFPLLDVGDRIEYQEVSVEGGNVLVDIDGAISIAYAGSVQASDSFQARMWDASLGTWTAYQSITIPANAPIIGIQCLAVLLSGPVEEIDMRYLIAIAIAIALALAATYSTSALGQVGGIVQSVRSPIAADSNKPTYQIDPQGTLSVTDFGAIGNDTLSDKAAIFAAGHAAKCQNKLVKFPVGSYFFANDDYVNGYLSLTSDYVARSDVFLSSNEMNGLAFDCVTDTVIGLRYNFNELKVRDLAIEGSVNFSPITSGYFERPPLAVAPTASEIDIIAHWWTRFGTDWMPSKGACVQYFPCKRSHAEGSRCAVSDGSNAAPYGPADYTWEWGHKTGARADTLTACPNVPTAKIFTRLEAGLQYDYPEEYDGSRHPLLGWYRENDPATLDWISYWLVKHGVDAVTVNGFPSTPSNWAHGLFNNAPNFQLLKYIMWMTNNIQPSNTCSEKFNNLTTAWTNTLNATYLSANFKNSSYKLKKEGVDLPLLYVFGSKQLVDELCVSDAAYGITAFLQGIGVLFGNGGFDGYVLASDAYIQTVVDIPALAANDIHVIEGAYNGISSIDGRDTVMSYEGLAGKARLSYAERGLYTNSIVSIPTAAHSVSPHYSRWQWKGSTPLLFQSWLDDTVSDVIDNWGQQPIPVSGNRPFMFVYNVSEWLEAGASLQPSVRHKFGYLDAVKSVKEKYTQP